MGVLWGTIPQEYWKIPVWERESSFDEKTRFLGKPTSSEIEEERDASLGKEPVLESSQSRTLRVWPLVKDDHFIWLLIIDDWREK